MLSDSLCISHYKCTFYIYTGKIEDASKVLYFNKIKFLVGKGPSGPLPFTLKMVRL